ncbi:MAG TPA: four helix bundle protein [Candidatus Binatia bacterium]|nr:four helix bundle protein [Candidatus Binatia bacterium]
MKQFENLEVWKDARQLTQRIYHITQADKFSKDFALRDQIRRATVFIMSNIAEGFERGRKPRIHSRRLELLEQIQLTNQGVH